MSEQRSLAAVRHTPGPWRARRDAPNPWWLIEADEHMVADVNRDVMVFNDPLDPTRVEANARLIAAAPELLALAKQYASECGLCDGTGSMGALGPDGFPTESADCTDCADIRAVIAKAEGREHG